KARSPARAASAAEAIDERRARHRRFDQRSEGERHRRRAAERAVQLVRQPVLRVQVRFRYAKRHPGARTARTRDLEVPGWLSPQARAFSDSIFKPPRLP